MISPLSFESMTYKKLILAFLLFVVSKQGALADAAFQLKEAYDPGLKRLSSLALLNKYVDSLAEVKNISFGGEEEVRLVNTVIENRFYHSYSHYLPEENWLGYVAGNYVWDHLSAIVIADDILNYEYGACSQQSIVMMKLLKMRGFKVRKVGLVGHFTLEVFYNDGWYFYDPNKEPLIQGIKHEELPVLRDNGQLAYAYSNSMQAEAVNNMFSQIETGNENEYPAKKARVFHRTTKFLSNELFTSLLSLVGIVGFTLVLLKGDKNYYKQNRRRKAGKLVRKVRDKDLVKDLVS